VPEQEVVTATMPENPQLFFEIAALVNQVKVANTIFTNAAPDYQTIILTITTNADNTVFSPGTLVPPSQAPAGPGSVLYLDLTNLNLSPAEFNAIQASAAGWSFAMYADTMAVGMTPATNSATLNSGPGNSVEVQITGLAIATPPLGSSAQLDVTYYQVPPTPAGDLGAACYFKVLLQRVPDVKDGDLSREIALSVDNSSLVCSSQASTVANKLVLTFGVGPDGKTVVAGPNTAFVLTFVYAPAPGYGALTDKDHASAIEVTAGPNATNWQITRGGDLQDISWLLQPPAGKPIIGTGTQGTVAFNLGNIVTFLRSGPTTLLLSYSSVPGYQDGSFAITLYKIPHVAITSLAVTPNPAYAGADGSAAITVSWAAQYATALALQGAGEQDVTGTTSIALNVRASTSFTLHASGPLADRDNVDFRSTKAVVLPRIDSFQAAPNNVYYKDFPATVTFNWTVESSGEVEMVSSLQSGSDLYPAQGTAKKILSEPQSMTLVPAQFGGQAAPARSNRISACTLHVQKYPLTQVQKYPYPGLQLQMLVCAAPSPTTEIIALAGTDAVWFVDSLLYQPIGDPFVIGAWSHVAFAPDGTFLVVASELGNLWTYQITETNDPPYVTLNRVELPTVSGKAVAAAVSADCARIFVVVRSSGTPGSTPGSLVILSKSGSDWTVGQSLAVGIDPSGVALDPTAERLFVSNSSGSVSIIARDPQGVYAVVSTVPVQGGSPTGIAVTPNGAILLVACSARVVWAFDARNPLGSAPQPLSTSGIPVPIAILPGGKYAMVGLSTGAAALISCADTPATCCLVEQGALVESGFPMWSLQAAGNGWPMLPVFSTPNLVVLTLASYVEPAKFVALSLPATDVAPAADGSQVFAWRNALGGGPPQPGLSVYSPATGAVRQVLPDQAIAGFVCTPDPKAHTAYAIVAGQGSLLIVDTQSFQTQRVPLAAAGVTRNPQAVTVAADGYRLFVVANDGAQAYFVSIFDLGQPSPCLLGEVALYTAPAGQAAVSVCATPDGSQAFVANSLMAGLCVVQWSGQAYTVSPTTVPIPGNPGALAILPDGSKVYALSSSAAQCNAISAVDASSLSVRTVHYGQTPASMALQGIAASPDGRLLFVVDAAAKAIRAIDPVSLRCSQQISLPADVNAPSGICSLPDGSRLITANIVGNNLAVIEQVQPA